MATGLQAFTNHEFGTIRTITSGGQILFCGKDVATALGYANTKDALARLVSSKLPAARQFEAWVFDDVLPSIRRHGMYAIDELLADDEFLEQRSSSPCGLSGPSASPPQALLGAVIAQAEEFGHVLYLGKTIG